jgi:hypothetical protein
MTLTDGSCRHIGQSVRLVMYLVVLLADSDCPWYQYGWSVSVTDGTSLLGGQPVVGLADLAKSIVTTRP